MFVHDFVVVRRPFGEVLTRLPFLLESELAGLIHAIGQPTASATEAGTSQLGTPQSEAPHTVVIGSVRERLDAVVYPVAWSASHGRALSEIEADIELSVIDGQTCDLHLMGRCTADADALSGPDVRRRRRETVHAVRYVLEHLKRTLETTALYAPRPNPAAWARNELEERTLARDGASVRPTEET